MILHDVQQRTPEWAELRLGRVCASRAAEMLAVRQDGKPAAGRQNLKIDLVLERVTGRSMESGGTSKAMEQGIEREASAVGMYELLTGRLVRSVGFVAHETLMAGYSPDGVIGNFEGLLEAKCPIPATHWVYLRTEKVPGDYLKQVIAALWITGAPWCDWLSFNPDFPEPLQVQIVRVHRDEEAIAKYERDLKLFLHEIAIEVEAVRTMADVKGQLQASLGVPA